MAKAAKMPAGPPPTIITSYLCEEIDDLFFLEMSMFFADISYLKTFSAVKTVENKAAYAFVISLLRSLSFLTRFKSLIWSRFHTATAMEIRRSCY